MEGTYGHPARRTQSPMTIQTPTSAYQVNVRRNKTRKWVEAKVQSYDGDDWGADEFDDDDEAEPEPEPEPVPSPPQVPSTLRTYSGTELPSSRRPSPSSSSGLSGLPSLRVQTQPSLAVAPANPLQLIGVTSPVVSDLSIRSPSELTITDHPVSPQSTGPSTFRSRDVAGHAGLASNLSLAVAAQPSSQIRQHGPSGHHLPRSASFEPGSKLTSQPPTDDVLKSPQSVRPAGHPVDRSLPFIQSSEIYRRMEEDKDQQRDFADGAMGASVWNEGDRFEAPKLLSVQDRRDTWERDDESVHSHPSDQLENHQDFHDAIGAAAEDIDHNQSSTSPNLPDLTRMSTFETHLFATPSSESPIVEQGPNSSRHSLALPRDTDGRAGRKPAALPHQRSASSTPAIDIPAARVDLAAASLPSRDGNLSGAAQPDTEEEESSEAPGGAPLRPLNHQQAGKGFLPSIPPLRTPSPHDPRNAFAATESLGARITPTEPLQPRQAGGSVAEPDLQPPQSASTYTSSPLKESDMLSEEIMKSLSPRGAAPEGLRFGDASLLLSPGSRNAARESSYTLGAYDSYWADTSDIPESVERRDIPAPASPSQNAPPDVEPLSHISQSSTAGPTSVTSPETQETFEGTLSSKQSRDRRRFSWEAEEATLTFAPQNETPAELPAEGGDTPALRLIAPPGPSIAPSLPILAAEYRSQSPGSQAPQVSEVSSVPEAPSPVSVSVVSDRGSATTRENARLSLVTATPSPDTHHALSAQASAASLGAQQASSSLAQAKVLSFRDIMGLTAAAERISKYNETRQILASQDTGLDNWLATLHAQHSEHGFAAPTPQGSGSQALAQSGTAASQVAFQPPAQQPYYQQYLNASSPSATTPQTGRSRLGGLAMPSQMAGSAFGHSGNQIGSKSKEFMHSAGKMGKGLLSKGKNKLRGSGDKETSPVHSTPAKGERRTSWRFSLELKPRENTSAPHNSEEIATGKPTPPPQPPELLNGASGSGPAFQWNLSLEGPDPETSPVKQPDFDAPLPPIPSPGNVLDESSPTHQDGNSLADADESNKGVDATPDDWIMVSHQSHGSSQIAATAITSEGGGGGLSESQPQTSSDSPKRTSSFIGLPPIRRASTFGLTSKARRTTERFSLDDDDDGQGDNAVATKEPLFPVSGHETQTPLADNLANKPRNEDRDGSARDDENTVETMRNEEPTKTQQIHHFVNQPAQPQAQDSDRQQYAGNPVLPIQQPLPMHPHMLANPIQRLPPAGPWILEESHLSEPLHLTKKRSGTDFSQQAMFNSVDKELGLDYPVAPMPPTQYFPGRLRSDVPPSSAQRYPGLFYQRPPQNPRQWVGGQPHPQQSQSRRFREESAMPRGQRNEHEVPGISPAEERGRKKRNSGVLKDIGTRIARATSKERRNSRTGSRPKSVDKFGDEVSDSSPTTEDMPERRKTRSSFLGLSSRRSSMDQGTGRDSIPAQQPPRADLASSDTPQSRREHKRSFLGAAQRKFSGDVTRSSASSLALASSSGLGSENQEGLSLQKKKLSNIAKATGIAGLFARSREDRSSTDKPHSHPAGSGYNGQGTGQPDLLPPGRGRSTTTGAFNVMPTGPPNQEASGRHSRGGSSSGFVSGILGYRSDSKTRDQPQAPVVQQQLHHEFPHSQSGNPSHALQPVSPLSFETDRPRPASLGPARTPPLTMRKVSEPHPLPLGMDTPMKYEEAQAGRDVRVSSQTPPVVQSRRSEAEYFETPPEHRPSSALDVASPQLQDVAFEQTLAALVGLESQKAADGDAEGSRPPAVSPDISVTSNGKMEQQGPAYMQSDVLVERMNKNSDMSKLPPTNDKPTENLQTHAALNQALSPQSLLSIPLFHEQTNATNAAKQSTVKLQLTGGEAPILMRHPPQASEPPVSHQPLASTSQQPLPLLIRKPQGENRSGSQAPSQGRQLPDTMRQLQYDVQERQVIVNTMAQERQRRYPPSTSISNASGASTPKSQNATPAPVIPAEAQSRDATGQKEVQSSRWKGLRSRVSDQMAQISQQQEGMGDKIKAGKFLGAVRRGSKQTEATEGQMNSQGLSPKPAGASQEQRYSQVPIPRGYAAVHGEGIAVPSPYYAGQSVPKTYVTQPRHDQQQAALPVPLQRWECLAAQEMVQSQHPGPPSSLKASNISGVSDRSLRHQHSRAFSADDGGAQSSQRSISQSQAGQSSRGEPQQDVGGGLGTTVTPESNGLRSASWSAGASTDEAENNRQQQSSNLGLDIAMAQQSMGDDDLYDATPKTAPGGAGLGHMSHRLFEVPRTSSDEDARMQSTGPVELEDTEEARKRAMRLASQEEKIFYEPEDYEAKMVAASYPGQEWKPYGEGEYGDWRED